MTDTTQVDVIAPSFVSAPKPARVRRQGYLFGPVFDFLTLGGGSVIVCGLIALLLPKGIPTPQQVVLITVLMATINQPHFAHSYQMFYRSFGAKALGASYPRALRLRYILAGIVVPALLIAFLGAALSGSPRVLAYGANLMFFLVGWHYVKQGYGILMVDSVQKRMMFSNRAKSLLRLNGYACWMVAWLGMNHELSTGTWYLGLTYFSLPIPQPVYVMSMVIASLTTLAVLIVLAQRWREAHALPWNGVIAYLTTLYLWVIFVRVNPLVLAVVPTFHSLQYLAVVWRYQLNAGSRPRVASPSLLNRVLPAGMWTNLAVFIAIGVALGYLGFMSVPRFIDPVLPYDKAVFGPSLFLFMFYIFINIHHYFLDNVMWRRGNPDVQQYIFAPPKRPSDRGCYRLAFPPGLARA
jgi:hypothetical protein